MAGGPAPVHASRLAMLAKDFERHLWPDFRNLIAQQRPPNVFGEQVASAAGRLWLAGVQTDMETAGYRFAASNLCAAGVGSPQRRQRLFWVADTERGRFESERQGSEIEARNDARLRRPECGREEIDGMAHARHVAGRTEQGYELQERGGGLGEPSPRSDVSLGDSSQQGLERQSRNGNQSSKSRRLGTEPDGSTSQTGRVGFWDDYRIVQTSDGKSRRIPVEPAFFPLAHGVSGRVALLKGYGNAIVPQVAAEFVLAYLDTLR